MEWFENTTSFINTHITIYKVTHNTKTYENDIHPILTSSGSVENSYIFELRNQKLTLSKGDVQL